MSSTVQKSLFVIAFLLGCIVLGLFSRSAMSQSPLPASGEAAISWCRSGRATNRLSTSLTPQPGGVGCKYSRDSRGRTRRQTRCELQGYLPNHRVK